MPISLVAFLIMYLLPLAGALILVGLNARRILAEALQGREKGLRLAFQLVLVVVAGVWAAEGYSRLASPGLELVNRALIFGLPALGLIVAARPATRWATRANPRLFPERFEQVYVLVGWVLGGLLLAWGLAGFWLAG